jgi:hypothetical protein
MFPIADAFLQTPSRLEAAWGAYIFFGRIRLSDGLITLTRKPVSLTSLEAIS